MAAIEIKPDEMEKSPSHKSTGYYLVSLAIMGTFIIMSLLGYFLSLINLNEIIGLSITFFCLTGVIIKYSHHLETVRIEKWGRTFRKYSHLAGGLFMVFFAIISPSQLSWIAFTFFLMFLIHEICYVKKNISSIYTKTLIFIGRLGRREESTAKPKLFYPSLWLLAAIAIVGLFGQIITLAAVMTFALGDSLSTIIGERWGKHKLPYNKTKSVEGSVTFFISSFLGILAAYLIAGQVWQFYWLSALIAASFASIVESMIPTNYWLDDNFVVPVGVGLILYFSKLV